MLFTWNYLVFGLATLIFNGLEIAMHATMNDKNCVDDVVIAHPILQVPVYNVLYSAHMYSKLLFLSLSFLITYSILSFASCRFLFPLFSVSSIDSSASPLSFSSLF
jgi:hypothetical protein